MERKYNLKSPAVKRLMREARELSDATEQYYAQPLEDNLFEWHFTVQGPVDSDFENGRYHGRITLPPEYPMKPPSIILLTPNGRFEIGKKICLSMSAYHPETWQPSWSIRTVLLAIIGFMPSKGIGAIGALDYTPEERKVLAKKSLLWTCNVCGSCNADALKGVKLGTERTKTEEAQKLAAQIHFEAESGEKPHRTSDTPDGVIPSSQTVSDTHGASMNNVTEESVDVPDTPWPVGEVPASLEDSTTVANGVSDLRRRSSSKRSARKRSNRNGQNSNAVMSARSLFSFYNTLIAILSACFLVLLLRRLYKENITGSS